MSKPEDDPLEKKGFKLDRLKNKAEELTKSGVSKVDSTLKSGIKKGKQVKDKIGIIADSTIKEIDKKAQIIKSEIISGAVKTQMGSNSSLGKSIDLKGGKNIDKSLENQIFSWMGWLWSIFAYALVIIIAFTISTSNSSYTLLPIILLIGFPIFIMWAVYNSIPELKFGDKILFSNKNLSMRRQLSFGKAVAKTFSKEMIRNSPEGALIIGLFLLLLGYVILNAII